MNELIRGFRPQSRIRRHHRKDVEIDIEIERGRLCPPVLMALIANACREDCNEDARDYVRTLGEWLGPSGKDLDCLDSHWCIEPDSGKMRSTGRLENAPFQ